MRLFVAADLPADLRGRLAALQRDLRDLDDGVRWVRPEGIHLTFVFLGEVAAERLGRLRAALAAAATAASPPFRLQAAGLGAFPDRGALRVVWVGIEGDREAAQRLHLALERHLAPQGFAPEERAFRPHLTLGRARRESRRVDRAPLERHRDVDLGEFPVAEVHLFESRLEAGGARYASLGAFPLGSAA
jgi:2'-5' RNA ligase